MTAIISGNSLGLGLSSWATLGSRGNQGEASLGRNGERAFVNVSNGNLVLQRADDHLVALGDDVGSFRTYNSQGLLDDDNADNWRMGVARLAIEGTEPQEPGATVVRIAADGSRSIFVHDPIRGLYVCTEGSGVQHGGDG